MIIPYPLAASFCLLHAFPSPVICFSLPVPTSRKRWGSHPPAAHHKSGDSGGASEDTRAFHHQRVLFLAPLAKAGGESAARGERGSGARLDGRSRRWEPNRLKLQNIWPRTAAATRAWWPNASPARPSAPATRAASVGPEQDPPLLPPL